MSDESKPDASLPWYVNVMRNTGMAGMLAVAVWILYGQLQKYYDKQDAEVTALRVELKEETKYSRDVVQGLLKQSIDAHGETADAIKELSAAQRDLTTEIRRTNQ